MTGGQSLEVQKIADAEAARDAANAKEWAFHNAVLEAKKQALLMGLGFGWMPRHLAEAELRAGTLREVCHVGGSRYRFTPMLVHRLDRPLGRTATRLITLLGGSDTPEGLAARTRPVPRRTRRTPG